MTSKAQAQGSTMDTVKLALALVIVTTAIAAFYYFADASLLVRVLALLGAAGAAGFVALQTDKGRQLAGFVREAQTEVRKVVWPTRQESVQTTLVVLAVVVVVALFLWGLDAFLGWAVKMLMGLGG